MRKRIGTAFSVTMLVLFIFASAYCTFFHAPPCDSAAGDGAFVCTER